MAASRDPLWTAERLAFSDTEGSIEMNISANSVSSSALPMLATHSDAAPDSVYVGKESAPSVTVDAFVSRHGIDPAATMLKLDVQGFEGTVLAGSHRDDRAVRGRPDGALVRAPLRRAVAGGRCHRIPQEARV